MILYAMGDSMTAGAEITEHSDMNEANKALAYPMYVANKLGCKDFRTLGAPSCIHPHFQQVPRWSTLLHKDSYLLRVQRLSGHVSAIIVNAFYLDNDIGPTVHGVLATFLWNIELKGRSASFTACQSFFKALLT